MTPHFVLHDASVSTGLPECYSRAILSMPYPVSLQFVRIKREPSRSALAGRAASDGVVSNCLLERDISIIILLT